VVVLGVLLVLSVVLIPSFVLNILEIPVIDGLQGFSETAPDGKIKIYLSPVIAYKPFVLISAISLFVGMLYVYAVIEVARHWPIKLEKRK